MLKLKLINLDKTPPRATTVLYTCAKALRKAGYKVEEDDYDDSLLIDPDRGPFPIPIKGDENDE